MSTDRRQYLFDTHAFLWLANEDTRLSTKVEREHRETNPQLWMSVASVWEMAIKSSLGKLRLRVPLRRFVESQCQAMQVRLLDIRLDHTLATESLPYHHRAPFDRLLIATSMVEQMTIVSRDPAFDEYPVNRFW